MKFSIPTPCHEDWSKMTPNEKGRHCNSCEKTVVDFSKMKDDTISSFLTENRHKKLCGRAKSTQLNKPLQIPPIKITGDFNWTKTFLYASFIAFGLSLYSCKNHDDSITGMIAIDESHLLQEDSFDFVRGQIAVDTNIHIKGDVMIEEGINQSTTPILNGNIQVVDEFMGDVAIDYNEETIIDIQKDSICIKNTSQSFDEFLMGDVVSPQDIEIFEGEIDIEE